MRQYIIVIMVQSIENIIVNSIKKCGRGAVLFPSDFSKVGERSAVLKTLKQMTDGGPSSGAQEASTAISKLTKNLGLGHHSEP